jgi:hypothetical protein
MKFIIQTIAKSIQIPFSIGIQISGSLLLEIYVFLHNCDRPRGARIRGNGGASTSRGQ